MTTGKVVRYDEFRGYGFASPVYGGEDVFIHVNDFEFDSGSVNVGTLVEFNIEQSERGPKASHIRLVEHPIHTPAPAQPPRPVAIAPVPAPAAAAPSHEDTFCDALSAKEFRTEVTEVLLDAAPPLTGEQILNLRESLVKFANSHNWIEA
jgi:cold shock CspA family protein